MEFEDKRKKMPHLYKPGQSGNPSGRPPMYSKEVKLIKKFDRNRYELLTHKFMAMPYEELKTFIEEKKGDGMEMCIASMVIHIISKGCPIRMEHFLCRMVGRSNRREAPLPKDDDDLPVIQMSPEERDAEIARLDLLDKELGND